MGWLIFGLIVAFVVVFGGWAIGIQRQLVSLDEMVKNATSQIGVQQNSRWDALTALADLTKGYSEHEYKTLMDVIGSRTKITANSSAAEVNAQESALNSAFGRLLAVAEAYPDLKANQMYLNTMDSVKTYEENVRMSRMVFNDTVTKFNRLIRQFPGSIIAGILGYVTKEYLAEPVGKTEMPSMVR